LCRDCGRDFLRHGRCHCSRPAFLGIQVTKPEPDDGGQPDEGTADQGGPESWLVLVPPTLRAGGVGEGRLCGMIFSSAHVDRHWGLRVLLVQSVDVADIHGSLSRLG